MSEMELHTGILKKVDTQSLTAGEWIKQWVNNYLDNNECGYYSRHRNDPDFNYKSAFQDITWKDNYIIVGDEIFKAYDRKLDLDLIDIRRELDGTYSYTVQFYNGGACLTEILENELESLENDIQLRQN